MEINILNREFHQIYHLDTFESVIWTERYIGYGDFEIWMPVDVSVLNAAQINNYVKIPDSDRIMIIEQIEIDSTFEDGVRMRISGRSLESILDRRIIWNQTRVDGDIQQVIKKLINENVISPSNTDRKISNFVFLDSDLWETGEASIDEESEEEYYQIQAQFTGDNLYDVILELCTTFCIGFKITINEASQFEFTLFMGEDRTPEKNEFGKFVIFSTNMDNLISSNYLNSISNLKNVALIGGEDTDNNDQSSGSYGYGREYVDIGGYLDLERRELFVDARDIQSEMEDETKITRKTYRNMLRQRGADKLAENIEIVSFEGEIDSYRVYEYGKDYDIGDVVKIQNELGMSANIRITEIVRSQDNEGYKLYPTFEVI